MQVSKRRIIAVILVISMLFIVMLPVSAQSSQRIAQYGQSEKVGQQYGFSKNKVIRVTSHEVMDVLVEEDFESLPVDTTPTGWINNGGDTRLTGHVKEENEGNKYLELNSNGRMPGSRALVYSLDTPYIPQTGDGKVKFSFDIRTSHRGVSYIELKSDTDKQLMVVQLRGGNITYLLPNNQYPTIGNFPKDTWVSCQAIVDMNRKVLDFYVDDVRVAKNLVFRDASASNVGMISLVAAVGNDGIYDFDNVKLEILEPETIKNIRFSSSTVYLQQGETRTVPVVTNVEKPDPGMILWESDDISIATVDSTGTVTGLQPGEVGITATSAADSSVKDSCKVIVLTAPTMPWYEDFESVEPPNLPSGWTYPNDGTFQVVEARDGQTLQVGVDTAEATTEAVVAIPVLQSGKKKFSFDMMLTGDENDGFTGATTQILLCDSSDRNLLEMKLDNRGILTAPNAGQPVLRMLYFVPNQWTTIDMVLDLDTHTASFYQDGYLKSHRVPLNRISDITKLKLVIPSGSKGSVLMDNLQIEEADSIPIEKIELDRDVALLAPGESLALRHVLSPPGTTDTEVDFLSSDEAVVTVSADGMMKAKTEGQAAITAQSKEDPTIQASCLVTVDSYAIDRMYFVAPDGDDNNMGSKEAPFQSIDQAQKAVRQVNSGMQGDIIVYLREGVYTLDESIKFTQEDSGSNGYNVIYRAYKDEEVVFTGGRQISDWELYDSEKNIYRAKADASFNTRQLYVDGQRSIRARSSGGLNLSQQNSDGHTTTKVEMLHWKNHSDIEMVYKAAWTNPRCGVDRIEEISGTNRVQVFMDQPGWFLCSNKGHSSARDPWYVENAYELLDEEGEWYLDRTGDITGSEEDAYTFYYKPRAGQDMNSVVAVAPVLEELMSLKGVAGAPVEHVKFEGLSFEHATWLRPDGNRGHADAQNNLIREGAHGFDDDIVDGAVNIYHVQDIAFTRCNFARLGSMAIVGHEACSELVITDSTFTDFSGGAIQLGNIRRGYNYPSDPEQWFKNNKITNNHITETGKDFRSSGAIGATYPVGLTIENNYIGYIPYTGIHIGWGWVEDYNITQDVIIKDNYIEELMRDLNDGGGIYTLGRTSGSKNSYNKIEGNYISNQKQNYGVIYLDEGADFYEVVNNVVELENMGVPWALSKHPTNIFESNYTNNAKLNTSSGGRIDMGRNTVFSGRDRPVMAQRIKDNAGQKEITDAPVPGAIETLLALADQIKDQSSYTVESWDAFDKARNSALAAAITKDATTVQESWLSLRQAMLALEKKTVFPVAPEELRKLIDLTEMLDSRNYTIDSWANLEKALRLAKDILNQADASPQDILQANTALQKALDRLVFEAGSAENPTVLPPILRIDSGSTETLTIYLGQGSAAARSASIYSDNPLIATTDKASVSALMNKVTVRGISDGETTINVTWHGGALDGQRVEVKVTVGRDKTSSDKDTSRGETRIPIRSFSGDAVVDSGFGLHQSKDTIPTDINMTEALRMVENAVAKAKVVKNPTAIAHFRNAGKVSLSTLQSMVNEAEMPLVVYSDTLNFGNRNVDARITFNPSKATKNMNLFATTMSSHAKTIKKYFEQWFTNKLLIVSCSQQDGFGVAVEIAVKPEIAINTEDLVFYSYNQKTTKYSRISNTDYWVDANGYIHFTTEQSGDIIISEGVLKQR